MYQCFSRLSYIMWHVPYHPHAHQPVPHPLDTNLTAVGDAAGTAFDDNESLKLDYFSHLTAVEVVYDKNWVYDVRTQYQSLDGNESRAGHMKTDATHVAKLTLGKDEFVVKVSGKHQGGITRLRLETNRGHYVDVGGHEGEDFSLQIPRPYGVKAFTGRVGDHLTAIGALIHPIFMRRSIDSQNPTRIKLPAPLPFEDQFPRKPENHGLRRIGFSFDDTHFLSLELFYWPEDRKNTEVPFPAVTSQSVTGDVFDLALGESLTAVSGTLDGGIVTSLGLETSAGRKRSWGTAKGTAFRDEVRPGHLAVGLVPSLGENGLRGVKLDVSYPLP